MLTRNEEIFFISTEISGEVEMIPIEIEDAYAIKETLEKDDLEDLLVEICMENEKYMQMVEKHVSINEDYIDFLINKIILQKTEIINKITENIARNILETAFEKDRADTAELNNAGDLIL